MGAGERDQNGRVPSAESPFSAGVQGVQVQPGPVWVEDLAGPEDYWLTLTDAARVTRRQEVTIRRWVAAGTLPIRNRSLGINKRTRHVRASDLAQLSPIVDASATISGATARIDLQSIPEQQAQMLQRQRELDQQAQSLMAQVEQVEQAAGAQQTQIDEQHNRLAAVESAAEALRTELTTGSQRAEKRHATLGRHLTALQQNVRCLVKDTKQLQEEQQESRSTQERIAERQAEQETEQRGHRERLQQLEKQRSIDARDRGKLQRRLDVEALRTNALEENLHRVEEGLTQLRGDMHQQAVAAREQTGNLAVQLQALQEHLREAENRSQAAAALFGQEHEQLRQLAGQVAALAAQMPGSPTGASLPGKKVTRGRGVTPSSRPTRKE